MPTTRERTRHLVSTSAVAAIAMLGVTLSACGSTDDPDEGATSPASPSTSSADPKAGWHPAKDDGGQFLVPADWAVEEGDTGPQLQAPAQSEGSTRVGGGSMGSSPTLASATIDDIGQSALEFHKGEGMSNVERLPDVTFGGVTFYHVRGQDSADWLDDYGTVNNGQMTTVLWRFHRGMVDRKQTDELINQVMATFEPAS